MNKSQKLVAFALLGLGGIATGYFAGSGSRETGGEPIATRGESEVDSMVAPPDAEAVGRAERISAGDAMPALREIANIPGSTARARAWVDLVASLDAEGVRLLLDAVFEPDAEEMLDERLGEEMLSVLIDRWVGFGPDAALREIGDHLAAPGAMEDPFLEYAGEYGLLFCGQRDPAKALTFVEGLRGDAAKYVEDLRYIVLLGVAIDDPERAVRYALENMDPADGYDVRDVFDLLGARSGEALQVVLGIEDLDRREEAIDVLFDVWDEADPKAAFSAASALEDDGMREVHMRDSLAEWMKRDSESAFEAWRSLDPEWRDGWEHSMLEAWATSDSSAAMAWSLEHSRPDRLGSVFRSLSAHLPPAEAAVVFAGLTKEQRRWGSPAEFLEPYLKQDPLAALSWLGEVGLAGGVYESSGSDAGMALAMRGPEAISAALDLVREGPIREGILRTAFEHTAFADPAAAQALLGTLSDSDREFAQAGLVMGWAESDPQAAATFAKEGGDAAAVNVAVVRWASEEPEAAYHWLVDVEGEDADAVDAIVGSSGLAKSWAHRSPQLAAEAMLGLPDDLAGARLGEVIEVWGANDVAAASEFVSEALQAGCVRDTAVVALVETLRGEDIEAAMAWARTIDDEAMMHQTMDSLATE